MKKILFIACIACYFFPSFAQTDAIVKRKVESLKASLPSLKGNAKVDGLNDLSDLYLLLWDDDDKLLDTACLYANMAVNDAKKLNYKKGLGYAYLQMEKCSAGRADNNQANNTTEPNYLQAEAYAQQVIKIGEELKDFRMVGFAYDELRLLEWGKGGGNKSKNYLEKAIYYFEKPVDPALCPECRGNAKMLGILYRALAEIISREGKLGLAEEQINKAVNYYEKAGANAEIGTAYMHFGNLIAVRLDINAGQQYIRKAIPYLQATSNQQGELRAYNLLCAGYWNLGDFENGLNYSKRAVQLVEQISKSTPGSKNAELGQAYYWRGRFYSIAGDYETALTYMHKGRGYYPDGIWMHRWALITGEVHRLMGNYDSAMYYLERFSKKIDAVPLGTEYLGNLYISMKQYDKGLPLINAMIETYQRDNNLGNLGSVYTHAAKALAGKKEYQVALTNARKGFDLLTSTGRNIQLIENYQVLSEIFNKLGKNDSAYYYLRRYTTFKDSLLNRQFFIRLNDLKKEAEEEKRTSQIKLLQKDNLIKQQQIQQQILLQQKIDAQLSLLNKNNEINNQQLLIKDQELQIKDQTLKEQTLLKEQQRSQLTLLDTDNKLKDQQLKQQTFFRNALVGGLFLFLLLGISIFRWLSLKQKNERLQSEKKQAELQQLSTDLEMQALRAQMNPHFIFNCLSSINKFILKNESRIASDYLTRFSRLIRRVLTNSQLSMIPLSDETEMLRLYLDMERLRFSNSFDYNIVYANTIEPETIYIPPMILQPFCENAIWHGLMHKDGQGRLDIVMSMEGEQLKCTITDNGIGRAKAAELKSKSGEKQKSFGLKITTERLALFNDEKAVRTFYNSEDVFDSEGNISGTEVTVRIKYKDDIYEPVTLK